VQDVATAAPSEWDNNGTGIVLGAYEGWEGSASGIVQDNVVTGSAYDSIGVYGDGNDVNLTRNTLRDPAVSPTNQVIYGINWSSDGKAVMLGNKVSRHDAGIYLGRGAGHKVTSNILTGNTTGLLNEFATGSVFKGNTALGGEIGLENLAGATGNTWQSNRAADNATLDCNDTSSGAGTAGTANAWRANRGATASPDPICG